MKELSEMTEIELLQTYRAVIDELHSRNVVRTNNAPIGDYTEWLVCDRLALTRQGNSKTAFDAVDCNDVRYQIKGRCSEDNSVQFSAIRNLSEHGFDFVVAVVFNKDYSIRFAVKIPHNEISNLARYQSHVNAYVLILANKATEQDGVEEITDLLF